MSQNEIPSSYLLSHYNSVYENITSLAFCSQGIYIVTWLMQSLYFSLPLMIFLMRSIFYFGKPMGVRVCILSMKWNTRIFKLLKLNSNILTRYVCACVWWWVFFWFLFSLDPCGNANINCFNLNCFTSFRFNDSKYWQLTFFAIAVVMTTARIFVRLIDLAKWFGCWNIYVLIFSISIENRSNWLFTSAKSQIDERIAYKMYYRLQFETERNTNRLLNDLIL